MPELREFGARNLRYIRSFYAERPMLDGGPDFALPSVKTVEGENGFILHLQVQDYEVSPNEGVFWALT